MAKKILIVAGILILSFVAAVGLLIATFDVNRYRPLLVQALEKQFNRPVTVGHLSLAWSGGLAVEVDAVAVYPDREGKEEPGLKFETAKAQINLAPLFRKKVEITSILLSKPYVLVEKMPGNVLRVGGIAPPKPGEQAPGTSKKQTALPVELSAKEIKVEDAHLFFRDLTGPSPVEIHVKHIDVEVKNFSLILPFSFAGKLALFNDAQNVSFEGSASQTGLKNLTLKTDLASFDLNQMAKAVPAVQNAGLRENLKGRLVLKMEAQSTDIKVQEGRLSFKAMNSAVDNMDLQLKLEADTMMLNHFSAQFAGGTLKASGQAEGLKSNPRLKMSVGCEAVQLDQLARAVDPNAPRLNGRLSVAFQGTASGLDWPQISRSLNGSARIQLVDGVFLNYNMLREVMQKISIIPGVEEGIRNNFPQAYQASLNERSTILQPVDLSATVQNGVFYFNPLVIQTNMMAIVGAGQVGLDQLLGVRAVLRLSNELSGILMQISGQLGALANPQGQLEVPITIEGRLPNVHVKADTDYIASRLLSSKTQEIVTGLVSDPKQGVKTLKGLLGKAASTVTS